MARNSCSSRWSRRDVLGLFTAAAASVTIPRVSAAAPASFPKGAVIRTVLRDYAPDELDGSATLFHEHLSLAPDFLARFDQFTAATRAAAGMPAPTPGPSDLAFMQNLELMVNELQAAKRDGIGCIVDGGHPDMGRNFDFLRQVSMRSGMPIVAGAGLYTQPYYPSEVGTMSEDQIVGSLIKQVERDPVGVFGEIGSWDDMTALERKVFRATGKAHLATNLPIFTHTGIPGKAALEQLDILEDVGVKPDRVVIGHMGNLVDPSIQVHKAICRRGAHVGFDRVGGAADESQVPMVMALIEAGFANRVMLSSDFSRPNGLKRDNGPGYAKTLTVFVPKLKALGASDEVLHEIMVDNPRRFVAFVPKKHRPR
jgi:phosphotriesterase-related protein